MRRTFRVNVRRTAYSSTVIEVEATDAADAKKEALAKAGDIEFPNEHDADYEADEPDEGEPTIE